MSRLHDALVDYLSVRRALGYKLERAGERLAQFVDYLDDAGITTITIEHALAWSMLPAETSINWWAQRLSDVRGFASWLSAIDPATEVPPTDLLPRRSRRERATPYLYSDDDIAALLAACGMLRPPLRAATYRTLLGLLTVTGMRIGEAIRLDQSDLDLSAGLLLVRSTKFGKDRYVPLHATTAQALASYLSSRARLIPQSDTAAVFVSTAGTRLRYGNVRLPSSSSLTRPGSSAARPPAGQGFMT